MTKKIAHSTILITGIMAAGKSTIAQALAEKLPQSVHLRGDVFCKMIVNGQAKMEAPLSAEALSQLRLRYQLAAMTANSYCETGFTVVYQDVIIGEILNEVIQMHKNHPLYVVVLCPSPEIALKRDETRHKQTYRSWAPDMLDHALRTETPRIGLWLDTSTLSIEESVSHILNHLDEAKISI